MAKNKDSIFDRLKQRYVFSIRNDNHFLESIKASLTIYEIIILGLVALLLSILLSFLLFKATPLRHFFGETTKREQTKYLVLEARADSLQKVLNANNGYMQSIQNILNGTIETARPEEIDSQKMGQVTIGNPTHKEMQLRAQVQNREQFTILEESKELKFLLPVDGLISNNFNSKDNHFGLDIVAKKNSPIIATADGVVLYTTWSDEDGHIIILSHNDDFISIYKHNERLLKKIGERVKAGDAIAILGNSGENTSGYHLHFELWKNGIPHNPQEYMNFKK